MKYKVGDKVLLEGKVVKIVAELPHTSSYSVRRGENIFAFHVFEEDIFPYKSRSSIGKKAYKTFIKNGGSRNSKGQFSKKKSISTMWWVTENGAIPLYGGGGGGGMPKKQKIDWEKISEEIHNAYFATDKPIRTVATVKRFAKVFQKHGLIDKGVEI